MALKGIATPQFLVLSGEGINCERETAAALERAGAKAQIVPLSRFLQRDFHAGDYQGLILPGGFSFGDELGPGQILALKMRHLKQRLLDHFIMLQKPILGICNGFQVLTKLGILPGGTGHCGEFQATLAPNASGRFINRWVKLRVHPDSNCLWTRGMESLRLPIRHGEGRLVLKRDSYKDLERNGQIPLQYVEEVNGSDYNIAGLCGPSGHILGLMPHPEAAASPHTYPSRENLAPGQQLFDNMVNTLQQS